MTAPEPAATIDEALVPFSEMARAFTDFTGVFGEDESAGLPAEVERIELDLPVVLEVLVADDGRVILGSAPPLYYEETGIEPVYHQLRLTIALDPFDGPATVPPPSEVNPTT
jgi:hypothetical protein